MDCEVLRADLDGALDDSVEAGIDARQFGKRLRAEGVGYWRTPVMW